MIFLSDRLGWSSLRVNQFTKPQNVMPTALEQNYFKTAHEQFHQLIKTLSADDSQGWEHGEVERYTEILHLGSNP